MRLQAACSVLRSWGLPRSAGEERDPLTGRGHKKTPAESGDKARICRTVFGAQNGTSQRMGENQPEDGPIANVRRERLSVNRAVGARSVGCWFG